MASTSAASVESLVGEGAGYGFVFLLDPADRAEVEQGYDRLVDAVAEQSMPILGFRPLVRWSALPAFGERYQTQPKDAVDLLRDGVRPLIDAGATRLFLLPVSFDFGVHQKQLVAELGREIHRAHPSVTLHYDDMDVGHPLLVQAFVDAACRSLASLGLSSPAELGVLLVAAGLGDAGSRAASYRLMRLVWEQLGAARGDVSFVKHRSIPLVEQLAACRAGTIDWLLLPQFLWPSDALDYAAAILKDTQAQFARTQSWVIADAVGEHPNIRAWLGQRLCELHRLHRRRLEGRVRSAKTAPPRVGTIFGSERSVPLSEWNENDPGLRYGAGVIAEVKDADELRTVLSGVGVFDAAPKTEWLRQDPAPVCFVKPTWHGYATGTFSDPVALDRLLGALRGRVVLLEGHTTSRNRAAPEWDWESDAREHRAWLREQELEYLEKTGLADVIRDHGATYVNVTEAFWDGQCAERAAVLATVEERGLSLHYPELAEFVPRVVWEHRGSPFVSFARFKGPTRLGISNLFGLLPPPFRSAWHGPNISFFAQVCCDLAKIYGALLRPFSVIEGLNVAVRFQRGGLYRSRWGNYDLFDPGGVVCAGRGLAVGDILASRLQGQDVTRSAFFDVVRQELGAEAAGLESALQAPLPKAVSKRFA